MFFGFLFSKAETAFKYAFVVNLAFTAATLLLLFVSEKAIYAILVLNPIVTCAYCMFDILGREFDLELVSLTYHLSTLLLIVLAQGVAWFGLNVFIDSILINRFKGADGKLATINRS